MSRGIIQVETLTQSTGTDFKGQNSPPSLCPDRRGFSSTQFSSAKNSALFALLPVSSVPPLGAIFIIAYFLSCSSTSNTEYILTVPPTEITEADLKEPCL